MEELTKCPDGKMRECGSDGKEHAILVTSEICSVCVPLKEKIKELEGVKCKTPEEHAEEKKIIESLRVTVEEEYQAKKASKLNQLRKASPVFVGDVKTFEQDLELLIDRHALINECKTDAYIMAEYLMNCYRSYCIALDRRVSGVTDMEIVEEHHLITLPDEGGGI